MKRNPPAIRHLVALLVVAWSGSAFAQAPTAAYPAKSVRIIAGFPPGSGADITARVIGQKLGETYGQQFLIDNRPGAGSNTARLPSLPELPTVAESGLPGFETVTWFGFVVPAATPRDLVIRLNSDIVRVLAQPEVRRQFAAQGIDVIGGTPEQFAAYIRDEIVKWARVIKESGARAE